MLSNEFMKFLCSSDEEKKNETSKKNSEVNKSANPLFYILLKASMNKN